MSDNFPLVSVSVITYNSSKYVLETLESIKAQTYQNIELIVSDDGSTDNTVEICREWIEKNKERFVRTELLTTLVNTGISANMNRAEEACRGEWVKGIAGDDLLFPECVEICVNYVSGKEDVVYLFGKIVPFGAEKSRCEYVERIFDYDFFNLTLEEQLHRLLFKGNCIPASTSFYNRSKVKQFNIPFDERIPLLEDWPKWINLLRAGIRFDFVDSDLVKYRVGGISTGGMSLQYYKSNRLMCFYYQFPEWIKENLDWAVNTVVDEECNRYAENIELKRQLNRIRSSFVYKCYSIILFPIVNKIRHKKDSIR